MRKNGPNFDLELKRLYNTEGSSFRRFDQLLDLLVHSEMSVIRRLPLDKQASLDRLQRPRRSALRPRRPISGSIAAVDGKTIRQCENIKLI